MSNRPQIYSYFTKFDNSSTYDPYASFFITNGYSNGTWVVFMSMVYTKPGSSDPEVFVPLLEIPLHLTRLRCANQGSFTDEFEAGSPANSRALLATLTSQNSAEFMETFFQLANQTAQMIFADVPDVSFHLSYQPWPQTITAHGRENGGDVLGIKAEDGDLTNIDVTIYWGNAEDDDLIYSETQRLLDAGAEKAKEMGVWNRHLYLNYAEEWQKPIRGYGEENVRILKEARWKYDPTQLFQKAAVGGFKLNE